MPNLPLAAGPAAAPAGPGLTQAVVARSGLLTTLKDVATEPMFLLLVVACAAYMALGEGAEAITLGAALLVVAGVSVYQSLRSDAALGDLRELTQPRAQVRREGQQVTVPLLAGWPWVNLFTPVHIIFLELVMGRTCSIAFENEPAEAGQMQQPPRPLTATFLAGAELGRSLVQGIDIAAAVLGVYYVAMRQGQPVAVGRTLVFTTLVLSNIFLTLVNRSFTQLVFRTLRVSNRVLWLMLGLTLVLLLVMQLVPPARQLFGFAPVPAVALRWCALAALAGVGWVEIYKAVLWGQKG